MFGNKKKLLWVKFDEYNGFADSSNLDVMSVEKTADALLWWKSFFFFVKWSHFFLQLCRIGLIIVTIIFRVFFIADSLTDIHGFDCSLFSALEHGQTLL